MSSTLLVALSLLLNALFPYWIVRWDLSRSSGPRLERAWPEASFLSAVLAFGPLCVPVHFAKTRRSLTGLALGLALGALCVLAETLIVAGLSQALGLE